VTYFSLLYNDKLAQAPETKVVKAKQFSKLIKANKLLTQIREEAEQFKREAHDEAELLKEEAQRVGFQEGLEAWNAQIAKLEEETKKVHDEVHAKVLPVVLKAARAVVGREMTLNADTIGDIVMKNLKAVADHKRITIYCHKDDYEKLQARKDEMKVIFERLENLVVQERDDVDPGGCIIETEAGIINAQWETQMRALEAALRRSLESS
jgi:type III secretion protein L